MEITRQRVAHAFQTFGFDVLPGEPSDRWVNVAEVSTTSYIASQLGERAEQFGGQRAVAAAYLAMRLSSAVVSPLVGIYLLERRVPIVDPTTARVRIDGDLEFDRLALGTTEFAAVDTDPATNHPDATTLGVGDLAELLAETLDRLLRTYLDGVRALAPFGRRGLWGLVADSVGGSALAAARETGTDHHPMWLTAQDILDRLQATGAAVENRPRPMVVHWQGRSFPFNIRGTCCLRYRVDDPGAHHDPEFGAYCHSCPLVDDNTLRRHYRESARTRCG